MRSAREDLPDIYKNIPDKWYAKYIGEMAKIATGDSDTQDKKEDGKYPFFVRSQIIERSDHVSFDGQAILTAGDGVGVGKVFHLVEGKFALHQRVYRITHFDKEIDPVYLYEYFRLNFIRQVVKFTAKTSVDSVRMEMIAKMAIPIPPLPEQKKIAQILSTWDNAISATERLLENSQQRKKALMQQLLTGKKRLPGFKGEWQWLSANEVFRTVSKKNNGDHEELLAVTQDQGVLPRSLLERRVVMPDGSTSGYKLVVPGNFIISLRSFQGGLEYSEHRGLVSPAYTVLEPTREINDAFYKQYYKSYDFIGHLAVAVIGIRDGKQISYGDFSFLKIPYPDVGEQQAIANVLTTADQEIDALQKRLGHLKLEKKALMQQLLTGKRRVQVDAAA